MTSLNSTIRRRISNVPKKDEDSRMKEKSLESTIRNKYNDSNPYTKQQQIVKKIIDESINFDDLGDDVFELVEKMLDDSSVASQKKSLAALIANSMARNPKRADVKSLILLLAALTLLSNSDGKDSLIQIARRLYSAGN